MGKNKNIIGFYFILFFICFGSLTTKAQTVSVDISHKCHQKNSIILNDILESVLGSKKVKRKVKKAFKDKHINTDNIYFFDLTTIYVDLDIKGEVKEIGFVRNSDGFLTKRQQKRIQSYIYENKIKFNVCWNNLSQVDTLSIASKEKYTEQFKLDLETFWEGEYRMNVYFFGYVTETLYEKYELYRYDKGNKDKLIKFEPDVID